MSSFNPDGGNFVLQVHIVQRGAVGPLVEMLQSPDAQLREMSAFALGRLAQVVNFFLLYFIHQQSDALTSYLVGSKVRYHLTSYYYI